MKNSLFALAVVIGLGAASRAHASPPDAWTVPATGCILDSRSTSLANNYTQEGSVSFASGQTGTIYLSCPIPPFDPGVTYCQASLGLTAFSNLTQGVGAWLDWTSITGPTGANTIVNVYSTHNISAGEDDATFTTQLDFSSKYYWVNVALTRSDTSHNLKFWGVRLYNFIAC